MEPLLWICLVITVAGHMSVSATKRSYGPGYAEIGGTFDYGLRGHHQYSPRNPHYEHSAGYAPGRPGYVRGDYAPKTLMLAEFGPLGPAYEHGGYDPRKSYHRLDTKYMSLGMYSGPPQYHHSVHSYSNNMQKPRGLYYLSNPFYGSPEKQIHYSYANSKLRDPPIQNHPSEKYYGPYVPYRQYEADRYLSPYNEPSLAYSPVKRSHHGYRGLYPTQGGYSRALRSKIGYERVLQGGYHKRDMHIGRPRNDYPPQHLTAYGPHNVGKWAVKLFSHEPACTKLGLFLRDAHDRCSYFRCVYGDRPMKSDGSLWVVPRRMMCPPGTSVPASYPGGLTVPCTAIDASCMVHKPSRPLTYYH